MVAIAFITYTQVSAYLCIARHLLIDHLRFKGDAATTQ